MFIELAINEAVFKLTVTAADPLYVPLVPLRPAPIVSALARLPAEPVTLSANTALCTYIVPVLT